MLSTASVCCLATIFLNIAELHFSCQGIICKFEFLLLLRVFLIYETLPSICCNHHLLIAYNRSIYSTKIDVIMICIKFPSCWDLVKKGKRRAWWLMFSPVSVMSAVSERLLLDRNTESRDAAKQDIWAAAGDGAGKIRLISNYKDTDISIWVVETFTVLVFRMVGLPCLGSTAETPARVANC